MALAALVMGLCVRLGLRVLGTVLPAGKLGELAALGLCALGGVALYFGLTLALGLEEAKLAVSFRYRKK